MNDTTESTSTKTHNHNQEPEGRLATDPQMDLIDAIYARRSVRGFLDKEIPEETLQRVLEIAQRAPSNCNVQPWEVFIAKGKLRDQLSQTMQERIKTGIEPNPDYSYRGKFEGAHRRRQVDCAVALYDNMGIERHDKEGRLRGVMRNYEFFDAPYMAFIGMRAQYGTTVAADVGMFAQTFMLTLVAFGLHSCAMGSMRGYPDLVRDAFEVDDDINILFGIAFGYEDPSVPANKTRVNRDPISDNIVVKAE